MRAAVSTLLIGLLVPVGAAHAATPSGVAGALERDPVYAERGAKPGLDAAEQGRLRIQIARQDIGRVKVAVVTQDSAARAGGLAEFAKAVDRDLRAKGNLIVVGGPGIHLITSYAPPEPATDALRKGVQENNDSSLADRLSAGIEGIAKVDPGASGDLGAGRTQSVPPSQLPDLNEATDSVVDTVKLVLLIVAGRDRAPVRDRRLLDRAAHPPPAPGRGRGAGRGARRLPQGRRGPGRADPRARPGRLDARRRPQGREAYERALAVYDEANAALTMRRSPASLQRARTALQEGHQRMAEAKRLLEAQLAARDTPQ